MVRIAVAFLIVTPVLPACDIVYGLTPVQPSVTVRYAVREVRNDADGSPAILEYPLDRSFSVVLDDGTQPQLSTAGDGSISFERTTETQGYRLRTTVDDDVFELQSKLGSVELVGPIIGRADRDVQVSATVTQQVAPPAGGRSRARRCASRPRPRLDRSSGSLLGPRME